MKILLVDDDDFLRDMYATKFTENGDDITALADGAKAYELLQQEPFDVLITDMVMPGVTGLDLVKLVHENESITCKCVVLSNQSESHDKAEVEALGVDGYIVKAEALPSDVVKKVTEIVSA